MYNITDIQEVLTKVSKGKDTLDQQTAKNTLDYIHDLEVLTDARGREKIELKDQLHRRNALIKKLRGRIKELELEITTHLQFPRVFSPSIHPTPLGEASY